MSPTTNPDFLQQILGQTPSIPDVNTPVPFAEDDLINERQKQLEALDPSNRVANLDPFNRNRRTGTNNTRSKKDKLNTALSYITEFLGAATGGPKYQNPYQRARIEAMEDYKLQAPRLIDELKILNQNKRSYEVEQSKEKLQKLKNEASAESARIAAEARRYSADKAYQTAETRNKILSDRQKFLEKYGMHATPETIAFMRSIDIPDISQATPEQAKAFLAQQQNSFLNKEATKSYFRALGQPSRELKNQTTITNYLDPAIGERVDKTTQRLVPVTTPPSPQNMNILRQFALGQNAQTQNQPNAQTSVDTNLFPNITPAVPTPQTQTQPQTPSIPVTPPVVKPGAPGAVAKPQVKIQTDTPPIEKITETLPAKSKKQYETLRSIQDPETRARLISDDSDIQARVWNIQSPNNPKGIQIKPMELFPGTQNKEQRKQFIADMASATSWTGMAGVVAEQFRKYDGKLFMGLGMPTAKSFANNAPEGGLAGRIVGDPMRAMSRGYAGRLPDQIDDMISITSTRNFLTDMFSNSGKQANQLEAKLFNEINPTDANSPTRYMERVLRLALAMNTKVAMAIKAGKTKNQAAMSDATVVAEIEKRVAYIMHQLKYNKKWKMEYLRPIEVK